MFTTLLVLLYPPLKGFSHRSDSHIRVESSLFKAPQGDLKPKCFRYKGHHCGIEPQLIKLEFAMWI